MSDDRADAADQIRDASVEDCAAPVLLAPAFLLPLPLPLLLRDKSPMLRHECPVLAEKHLMLGHQLNVAGFEPVEAFSRILRWTQTAVRDLTNICDRVFRMSGDSR